MVALGQRMEDDQGFIYMERRVGEMIDARDGIRGLRIGRNTNAEKGTVSLDSVTDRLEAIGASLPDLVFSPLVLWQMTSGIAHGNSAMMRNVLEKRQLGTFVDGSAAFELTTSIVALAMFYSAALNMIEPLLNQYERRNQPI